MRVDLSDDGRSYSVLHIVAIILQILMNVLAARTMIVTRMQLATIRCPPTNAHAIMDLQETELRAKVNKITS